MLYDKLNVDELKKIKFSLKISLKIGSYLTTGIKSGDAKIRTGNLIVLQTCI